MKTSVKTDLQECGKRHRAIMSIRILVFTIVVVASYLWFPVPSARMPEAKLWVNSWANRMSAELGRFACIGFALGDADTIKAQDGVLYFTRTADGTKLVPPARISYRNDNIVALALWNVLILCAYLFLVDRSGRNMKRKGIALVASMVLFAVCFLIRDCLFGIAAAYNYTALVGRLDNPVRAAMLILQLVAALYTGNSKQGDR